MGKRLNDTTGVVSMSPYESQSEHYNRSVRKIDNGFLVRESHHGGPNCPDGPTDKEVFMSEHPDTDKSGLGDSGNAMKKAVTYMKK